MSICKVAGLTAFLTLLASPTLAAQEWLQPDAPRPIDEAFSLWAEELTFMEIRDAIARGTTTIIIGTGGIEQNGPYVAGGKHNYVLKTVLPFIARATAGRVAGPSGRVAQRHTG